MPPDVYETWVKWIISSPDGVLTAKALRALARRLEEPDNRDDSTLPFAKAETRIRRLVAKLSAQMDGDGRARLPKLLESLSSECKVAVM